MILQPLDFLKERSAEGRQLMVYGAGNQGRGIVRTLRDNCLEVSAFIDRDPVIQGRSVAGLPVFSPDMLENPEMVRKVFVIIAAYFFEREISSVLESHGFHQYKDYLPYSAIKPNDYVVEISGVCNLHCISCPRGSKRSTERPPVMMNLETFKNVLAKIWRESPFVRNIQLYQWGEPTLNWNLPAMIRSAHEVGILCAISSNLNFNADYQAIIGAKPECFRISVSGTGTDYEITHTGGNWNSFLNNLKTVAELRRTIYPEMKIELYYHRYANNIGEQQQYMADLCKRLDIEFHPVPAYLISLDDVLNYCEGHPLHEAAQHARELLKIDLEDGLALARDEAALECDAMREILINADLSVSTCMMFYYPEGNTITDNYLNTPLEEILAKRGHAPLCARCKRHGIHRYCGIYAKLNENERC